MLATSSTEIAIKLFWLALVAFVARVLAFPQGGQYDGARHTDDVPSSSSPFHWQEDYNFLPWSPDALEPYLWSVHTPAKTSNTEEQPNSERVLTGSHPFSSPHQHGSPHSNAPEDDLTSLLEQFRAPNTPENVWSPAEQHLSPQFRSPVGPIEHGSRDDAELQHTMVQAASNFAPPSAGAPLVDGTTVRQPRAKRPSSKRPSRARATSVLESGSRANGPPSPKEADAGMGQFASIQNRWLTRNEWENALRRMLNNPNLQFYDLKQNSNGPTRLFEAKDGTDVQDHYAPAAFSEATTSQSDLSTSPGRRFANNIVKLKRKGLVRKEFGKPGYRFLVYLNSRRNMESLNQDYFHGHLRVLPLRTQNLDWSTLNKLLLKREQVSVLAPQRPGGLPVILTSYNRGMGKTKKIQRFTQGLNAHHHLFALWSQGFNHQGHVTVVLHGFGQLDDGEASGLAYELNNKATAGISQNIPIVADLAKYLHRR